ncbi:hypothetical protein TrRE_jg4013 [Triparma retinervis]|uniref:Mitochondrial carrier protein n=1 Tax=Triparma retinervis TaxID=2557542 RepID=A0A9W7DZC0_9STRA|nr:hypothetical protein TrRE_jg4013 [Triparma retinervis]
MVAKDFSSPPLTMRETILDLYTRGGVLVFWRGLTASLLGLSHVAVQFPIYEWMKEYVPKLRYGDDKVCESGPVDWMVASAASKLTACTLTYPHEVIRSRMMDVRDIDTKGLNVYDTAVRIVRTEGWAKRIESLKAGAIGGLVGASVSSPFLYLSSALLSPPNPTGQWEFQTDMASIEGALFAICFRYIVRTDTDNEMLKMGALGAFILVRTLPLISVPSTCSSVPLKCEYLYILDPATIPQVAFHGIESLALFGSAFLALNHSFNKKWLSPFENK